MAMHPMMESVWLDKCRVEDAERQFYEKMSSQHAGLVVQSSGATAASSSILSEIARARQNIQSSLCSDGVGLSVGVAVQGTGVSIQRLEAVEKENKLLKKVTEDLRADVSKLLARVAALEKTTGTPQVNDTKQAPAKAANEDSDDDDDDDDDFFGDSDEDDAEEVARLKAERLAAYEAKKSKKPAVIAKSNIVLDVKPWDDETDMKLLEANVRKISTDGLIWGAGKLVPVAYGIKKLQITCVVEDDKVGTDFLEEAITSFEDLVQSVDVAAFNKI